MNRTADDKEPDAPQEDGTCPHDGVYHFACGNLICTYYKRIQEFRPDGKTVYAACKCCGTLERIAR